MLSTVRQLDLARDYFARAPSRGTLTEAARQHRTSRPTAYRIIERFEDALRRGGPFDEIRSLQQRLAQQEEGLRDAYQQIGDLRRQLEPDPKQVRRFIVQAAVSPVSCRDTTALVGEAFRREDAPFEVSHEFVRQVVNAAAARAKQVFEGLELQKKARQAVGDEIFLGDRPLLVVAEPQSLAVLRLSVEEHRDQKTWAKLLEPLEDIEIFASDLGKGLTAAVEARGWPHQADVFHALRILTESWGIEERRCYEAIEEEYAWERRLQELRDAGDDLRGVATNYALARKKTQRALERFNQIERLIRQMRAAVQLCDDLGRWLPPGERSGQITHALDRLDELGLARRRRVAGYWRNPKLLTFAREAQRQLDAVDMGGALDRRDLLDAAVGTWARARRLVHGPGALVASLRSIAVARLFPDLPALCDRVAAILDRTLRASSAIECINSQWRVYQQVKKTFSTDFAYLVALHHNMHEFTEGSRRGSTPLELLGVNVGTRDWLSLVL